MSRWIWLAVGLGLLLAIALALREPTLPVEVAEVSRGSLQVGIEEDVQTRLRRRELLVAPLPGRIERIELLPGDSVSAGQPLLTLSAGPAPRLDAAQQSRLRAELQAAEAERSRLRGLIVAAEAAATLAEQDAGRARRLAAEQVIAPAALDQVLTEARVRLADLQAARAAEAAAVSQQQALQALLDPDQGQAQQLILRSPIDGIVLQRLRESSGTVAAGERLLEIGDPTQLEVVGELLSEDAVRLTAGALVELSGWGGPTLLRGRVERIEPAAYTKISALGVEEQRVKVIAVPDPSGGDWPVLGDGYRLRARYIAWSGEDRLLVPSAALQRDRDGWSVLRVIDGRASRSAVRIGRRNETHAEVSEGLAEGDVVILYGEDRVQEGRRVSYTL